MNYDLIKDVIELLQEFNTQNKDDSGFNNDVEGFKHWISQSLPVKDVVQEPNWEGKEHGRTAESVISTLIVHMNRYAKNYSKSAIYNSEFSTQEDFIYLINLKAFGAMTKMELVKKNVHDKSVGMQIINRLIRQGWVIQSDSDIDKRSKMVNINEKGLEALEMQMNNVRNASEIVAGDLTYPEKMQFIELLKKLNDFHHPIYLKNLDPSELLQEVMGEVNKN